MTEPSSSITKRPRTSSQDSTTSLQHDDYTVAWISALPLEMTAAEAMLDTIHTPLSQHPEDSNCYTLGSINGHNIVMACLPKGQYGTNNAATVASHLTRSFLNIQHRLMVGIGGGAPSSADVRLGDVVVSTEVLQYDLGKAMPDDQFQRIAYPIRPPQSLMTAVSKLQASQDRGANHFPTIILNSAAKLPHYVHPSLQDRLFQSDYTHPESSKNCDDCEQTKLSSRDARHSTDPVIHFGRIASGNQVIKDAHTRDKLSKELGCVCFEMEAAGMMDSSPYLTIRGICDYSDSHKNKEWQEYAALTAAAYTKDLLLAMPAHVAPPNKRRKMEQPEIPQVMDPEVTQCLEALFVADSAQNREDILDAKGQICEGTCKWVLLTDEFKAWEQNPPHLLWVSAPPGVGKTFLSIYLSKYFEAISAERSEISSICFFCDNKIENRNTAVNILRGLIHQMIALEKGLVKVVLPTWGKRLSQLIESGSFGNLWKVFEEMVDNSSFRTIYCVIDALDECERDSLSLLLSRFERLSDPDNVSPNKIKLVCLSRRLGGIEGHHVLLP
ncbi:pfs domain-containing protein [Fusarium flagelliforme]|uniref:pfs domain-containing protein n=1 Tax=Fusarium flagelliforme TaxID=2675880 RepID=UPI001E8D82B8|nr:pfs domain-containing protein [Fusarium flagelliforme]KAH7174822.1 pfs domain-containing protein [Fusarium flagelliforme]